MQMLRPVADQRQRRAHDVQEARKMLGAVEERHLADTHLPRAAALCTGEWVWNGLQANHFRSFISRHTHPSKRKACRGNRLAKDLQLKPLILHLCVGDELRDSNDGAPRGRVDIS